MKIPALLLLSIVLGSPACAQTTQPSSLPTTTAALSSTSSLDDILDALDRRGQNLHSLTAAVSITESDAQLGEGAITRGGKVWLRTDDAGATRFRAFFDRYQAEGQKPRVEKKEYALVGDDLIDRDYAHKKQITHHLDNGSEKLNLLKLGEGPFPLPIGQSRDEVYKAFDATKIDATKSDPGGCVHIRLIPKAGTALAEKMKSIDVWVDTTTELPQRIETLDPRASTRQRTELKNLVLNGSVSDADLLPEKIDDQAWDKIDDGMAASGQKIK